MHRTERGVCDSEQLARLEACEYKVSWACRDFSRPDVTSPTPGRHQGCGDGHGFMGHPSGLLLEKGPARLPGQ